MVAGLLYEAGQVLPRLVSGAAGLPVLAAKVGGLRRLVQNGYSGLHFEPGIPATLMSAYERIVREPGLRESIVGWARQEVRCYSWPVIGRELARLYEGVCHG